MKKTVDKSVLSQGLSVRTPFQDLLYRKTGIRLKRGESAQVRILIDGQEYGARLINQQFDEKKYPNHMDILQIRYDNNRELLGALRAQFRATWEELLSYTAANGTAKGFSMKEGAEEYISIFAAPVPGTLLFECISADEYGDGIRRAGQMSETVFETVTDAAAGLEISPGLRKIRHLSEGIGNTLKAVYGYRCQICGEFIGEKYGSSLIHAHHIDYFTKSLNNDSDNIMIVCPNHHGIIHDRNPVFDRSRVTFTYPNGYTEGLKLNRHIPKRG